MHVERTATYDADLPTVLDVLVSSELANARTNAGRLDAPVHSVTDADTAPEAVTTVTVPADRIPEKARRFVSRATTVTIRQKWDGKGPDRASADFTVDVGSLPVKIDLTQTLTAEGDTTTASFSGEIRVTIPLIGPKLEKLAVSQVDAVLKRDQRLVNEILAAR
ncbi:DUF2505 domain-containing protein [Flaviflexus salsibiostraticola]|uniref:DUF2505 domain-containing protein n=1 Tax=Flaviflexus salsibiostraticola TaxID=1282737 RepID=A0A3S8Z8M6_9ACTO|nr:DUF2505 domain-containing protein [Flaviflexus salsibiostraticola]AZN29850.1 DUF2505 domain-containing protein [Flaviflexus salsibiostraticola]